MVCNCPAFQRLHGYDLIQQDDQFLHRDRQFQSPVCIAVECIKEVMYLIKIAFAIEFNAMV